MSESTGLATLEPLTARVGLWRHRHRAQTARVSEYRVEYDGSVIATLSARSAATLDEELASAGWELAQSIARPVTIDVIASDSQGEEVARLPLRIQPTPPPASSANASTGDLRDVIRVLLDANQNQQRMIVELATSVSTQMREVMQVTAEIAKGSQQRVRALEAEVSVATDTVRDAIALAHDASAPRRTLADRGLDLVEGVLRDALTGKKPPTETPSAESPPVEAVPGEVVS